MRARATAAEVATVAAPIYVAKLMVAFDRNEIVRGFDCPKQDIVQFEKDCQVVARDSVRHARLLLEAAANG